MTKAKRSFYYHAFPVFPNWVSLWFIAALDVFIWHFFHILLIIFLAVCVGLFYPTLQIMPTAYVINRFKYVKWDELEAQAEDRKRGIFRRWKRTRP
jgi:hypothetical protein